MRKRVGINEIAPTVVLSATQSSGIEFHDPHGEWRLCGSGLFIVRICRNQTSLTQAGATQPANDRFPQLAVICVPCSICQNGLTTAVRRAVDEGPVLENLENKWLLRGQNIGFGEGLDFRSAFLTCNQHYVKYVKFLL